ncbi:MAG: DUF424 domain-containing protein [Candidatus Bathyarchaeota archaeon]|nr:MAG: DUF424 domain-containing protein [Candidatus Bathyarchaeota archaeon]
MPRLEVYVNVQRRGQYSLLAACDAELLGMVLHDGKVAFEVRKEFYMGSKVSVEEAVDLMKQSAIVNMVGRNIVEKAIEKGLIHPEAVLEISGVPHAQIVKM